MEVFGSVESHTGEGELTIIQCLPAWFLPRERWQLFVFSSPQHTMMNCDS